MRHILRGWRTPQRSVRALQTLSATLSLTNRRFFAIALVLMIAPFGSARTFPWSICPSTRRRSRLLRKSGPGIRSSRGLRGQLVYSISPRVHDAVRPVARVSDHGRDADHGVPGARERAGPDRLVAACCRCRRAMEVACDSLRFWLRVPLGIPVFSGRRSVRVAVFHPSHLLRGASDFAQRDHSRLLLTVPVLLPCDRTRLRFRCI